MTDEIENDGANAGENAGSAIEDYQAAGAEILNKYGLDLSDPLNNATFLQKYNDEITKLMDEKKQQVFTASKTDLRTELRTRVRELNERNAGHAEREALEKEFTRRGLFATIGEVDPNAPLMTKAEGDGLWTQAVTTAASSVNETLYRQEMLDPALKGHPAEVAKVKAKWRSRGLNVDFDPTLRRPLMETMEQLIEARRYVTSRTEYDRLSLQIAEAGTLRELEENKKRAEIAEAQKAEMLAKKTEFKNLEARIEEGYSNLKELDDNIFEAVALLITLANQRLSESDKVFDIENTKVALAAELRLPPVSFREPKLFGGAPVSHRLNVFLKVWLQRYIDRLDRDGKVTPEAIAEHGLQGGTELDDHPNQF